MLIRAVSVAADTQVVAKVGATVRPLTAVVFMLNSLTGLSLLTLPYGFSQAGILLGSTIVAVCMLFAYITATFMCEALTIANALHYDVALESAVAGDKTLQKSLHDQRQRLLEESLLDGCRPLYKRSSTLKAFEKDFHHTNMASVYKIRERVELGAMGEVAIEHKTISNLIYVMILCFTYGTSTALVVMVNSSLSSAATGMLDNAGWVFDKDLVYRLCVAFTFVVTLPLCFANLQRTKKFTMVIMVCRFLAIILILVASGQRAAARLADEGAWNVIGNLPMWRPDHFMAVFGNAVFLFGLHHYLPGMVAPLEPQQEAPRVIFVAFSICYMLMFLICSSALVAWGDQPFTTCSSVAGGHFCQIQPLYNINFAPLDWAGGALGFFIILYPAMAIASIPIAAITTRNTLGQVVGVVPPDPEAPYTPLNILMTLSVLVPPFSIAMTTRDVQAVVQYTGSYAGLSVAFLCPLVLVLRLRHVLDLDVESERKHDRPLKSPFANGVGYGIVALFYIIALVLATRKLFFT